MIDLPSTAVPTIPVRAGFYFPGVKVPLSAGRKRSRMALTTATEGDGFILLIHQREIDAPEPPPESFPTVGTLARVTGDIGKDGRWSGSVYGVTRAWVKKWRKSKLFLSADVQPIHSVGKNDKVLERLRAAMIRGIELDPKLPGAAAQHLSKIDDLSLLTDIAAQNSALGRPERQRLLETTDAVCRAAALIPAFEARAAQLTGAPPPLPRSPHPTPRDNLGEPPSDPLQRARYNAAVLARCGGLPPVGVVELAVEDLGDLDEAMLAEARTLARQEADDRRATEDRWPLHTDFDRLDAAFVALNHAGIAARHDWGLNESDGRKLFAEEVRRRKSEDRWRGFVFYHHELTRDAAMGKGLRLLFDARSDPALEVGREIVDALRKQGLPAWWNEDPDEPIEVPIRWQRRMPPDPM